MTYSLYTSDPFLYPGGGIAAGIVVSVYFAATSVHAPIFHDDLGTIPKTNPTRTDNTGRVSFWIEPGSYVLSANGVRTPIDVAVIPAPPGPDDYVTRAEMDAAIAAAGGSSLPPITAKGQLYAGLAAGSVGLLAVGTNGQVLSADSTAATGLRWIDAASGGGAVASVFGRTGAVIAQAGDYTKSQVGLGNVDNTSDATKFANTTLTGTTTANRIVITPDALAVVAGAVATDASLGNHFEFTADANFTLSNPTNPSHGQRALWAIKQDATGGRIMTLGSAFQFGTDVTSAVLSTAANKTDLLGAVYDAPSGKWRVALFLRGYA